jgi:DNA-binding IscR family transcriptional regulator
VVSSTELADNICTNPARVRKVLSRLHKAGLVEAQQGQGRGYRALPGSGEVTLEEVLRALEEEPVTMNWRSGDMDRACLISSGMGDVMADIYAGMNECCLKQLRSITINSINDRIFGKDEGKNE